MTTQIDVGGAGASRRQGAEWLRVPQPALFLRMEIDRDLTVRREPSFAYPVLTDFFPVGRPLPFEAEFLDGERRTLSCATLREDCWHCSAGCWPKHVRQTLSFPVRARMFRIVHRADVIYEEDIPDPATVDVECDYDAEAHVIRVRWQARIRSRRREAEAGPESWYLVQYNARGVWRGLGPRTQSTEASIDLRQLSLPVTVPIRVLATSGIATGIGECVQDHPATEAIGQGSLIAVSGDPQGQPVALGQTLRVHAVDEGGRSLPDVTVRWYDEAGRELIRGRDLDVAALGAGEHVVHAIATGSGGRPLIRTFFLRRASTEMPCHLVASHVPPRRADAPVHRHDEGEMHDY